MNFFRWSMFAPNLFFGKHVVGWIAQDCVETGAASLGLCQKHLRVSDLPVEWFHVPRAQP